MLAPALQRQLLGIARQSIEHGLRHGSALAIDPADFSAPLRQPQASFVTLTIDGQLRGCIGTLEVYRSLVEDVAGNAYAAAFQDPRFRPLGAAELAPLLIHVSVLSPSMPMTFSGEEDLLRQLRPGVDGLVIQQGSRRATFLPSVWEQLPEPTQFLLHLMQKAGIGAARGDLQAWRYTTESFSE